MDMNSGWWFRFSLIMVALLASIYVLLPTFVLDDDLTQKSEQLDGAPAQEDAPLTGWKALLPDTAMVLGLDLRGGIDLTLDVDSKEAVLATVARDLQPIQDMATSEGLELAEVQRVRGEPAIEVAVSGNTDLGDVQDFFATRFPFYQYQTSRDDEGVELHRFAMTDDAQAEIKDNAIEQAVEMLRTRVNETGVKEPSITRKGNERINVQLPGEDNLQQAVQALGTTAVLEFMMVDEDFDETQLERALQAARDALSDEEWTDDDIINDWLVDTGRIGKDNRVMFRYEDNAEGILEKQEAFVLHDTVILTGDDINDAQVAFDNRTNRPYVALEFKPKGGQVFAQITGDNVGKRFAIILDRKIRSAPVINERIGGGRASITMGSMAYEESQADAQILSLVLRTGALPAPVNVGEVRIVGPSLGQDAIESGEKAVLIGMLLVVLAMAIYYRKLGLVADLALMLNVFFVMALLAGLQATLTLPGIAGIALTVGMAVDANIIIFERIREEHRLGKNARAATDAGFEHALSAVLDANITTGIAGVVLYSYGTGPLKGFAVTLMIGIITTLFTAIFVSRTFMDFVVRKSSARLGI